MAKKVTVFSTTHCGSCKALKKWLDDKSIAYDSVNLEDSPERMAEVIEKSGSMQVPVTFVTEGDDQDTLQVINGPNYGDISKALGLA